MMNLRDLRGGDCCSSQDDCCRRCDRHAETSANGAVRDGARGDTCDAGRAASMKRVVFVGNPNVGKSSMFNALLGARTRTMNAPGTTVSITCGQYRYKSANDAPHTQLWQFVDTPGTYSLLPMSPDEQVAVDALIGASGMPAPDLAAVVLDATALSRSLYLLSMVTELGLPTVIALTMNDLALRNGHGVDAQRLSRLLDGMPVIAVDGRTGDGGEALADAIAVGFRGTPIPSGLTAWSAITADADGHTVDDLRSWAESRADARLDWTAGILRRLDVHDDGRVTLSDRIDGMLLHPVVGVIVFLAVLFTVFQATTTLASPMQDWIDVAFRGWCTSGLDWLLGLFGAAWRGGWVRSLLVDGVLDGVITVLTFIPVMGIMFLLLSILEDSGYMARAAFVMDRAMRALGLDGRAFLPIIVGFGCNLPALAATRTLPDSRQRVLTGMLVPFAACSARLSVFLVLAHAFFPKYAGLVVFLMYVVSVMIILLVGVMLRHTMFRGLEPEPLMLALPSYQCPPRPAAGSFGAAASMGIRSRRQCDHHLDDHGAMAAAGHSHDGRCRRFRACRRCARFRVRRARRCGGPRVRSGGLRRLACVGRADYGIRRQGSRDRFDVAVLSCRRT